VGNNNKKGRLNYVEKERREGREGRGERPEGGMGRGQRPTLEKIDFEVSVLLAVNK
jgi:hypothetical protein